MLEKVKALSVHFYLYFSKEKLVRESALSPVCCLAREETRQVERFVASQREEDSEPGEWLLGHTFV